MHAEPTAPDGRLLDICGRLRSPASMPGYHAGRPPVTKGRKYPPDPLPVEDIAKLLAACPDTMYGQRLRALMVLLWRSGLRISEALALEERDLNPADFAVTVRRGKGGKRRVSAMDEWGWREIRPWLEARRELPFGALFPVIAGPTAGRPWTASYARKQMRDLGRQVGLRRRVHPHSFRHEHAVELWREGVDLYAISRQLGHANPAITTHYLQGLAPMELLEPIGRRRAPTMVVPHLAAA